MRNPMIAPLLPTNKRAQLRPRDSRRPKRIQRNLIPEILSELGCGEAGNGAAKGMARGDDFVAWTGGKAGFEGGENEGAGVEPGLPEAVVGSAAGAEVGCSERELEVCDPVFEGA